ncbi:uncharacterized protein LOC116276312 [Papio anubis]|uniref:uncharacterized protein LOC116276312 n=1 Tax=Papio anubis TaxID=9555 RepID=UPI0012AE9043|nr:uncharacterized protein LOC116276312 [Papio anubis]
MANLRHPTWRMESSPSSPRGADACPEAVLFILLRGAAAPRFEPRPGRGPREGRSKDLRIGSLAVLPGLCQGDLRPAACGAAGLGVQGEFWARFVSQRYLSLPNLGQRINFSCSQFTDVSIGVLPTCIPLEAAAFPEAWGAFLWATRLGFRDYRPLSSMRKKECSGWSNGFLRLHSKTVKSQVWTSPLHAQCSSPTSCVMYPNCLQESLQESQFQDSHRVAAQPSRPAPQDTWLGGAHQNLYLEMNC